jgi:GMP synthase (glutamine-hydrolysing)
MGPILVIDAYLDERGGAHNFERLLRGRPLHTVRATLGSIPARASAFTAVLVSGSAASVLDPLPWFGPLVALLQDALRQGVPVLGICFGHQVLSQAAFGAGAVRRAPRGELGWVEVERLGPDPLLDALPERFTCFSSHHDEVVEGPGMQVLARSERCAVQAYRVLDRAAWGVQFHPEMERAETDQLVRTGLAGHPDHGEDPEALLAAGLDTSAQGEALMQRFLELHAPIEAPTRPRRTP